VFIVTRDGGCLRPIVDGLNRHAIELVATADQEALGRAVRYLEGLFGGVLTLPWPEARARKVIETVFVDARPEADLAWYPHAG
jgi:hypothetical protein